MMSALPSWGTVESVTNESRTHNDAQPTGAPQPSSEVIIAGDVWWRHLSGRRSHDTHAISGSPPRQHCQVED